jgi:3'-phosphoadenosine 5'-phosphosulfate (PAPS) 3'-phosphatase
LECSRLQAAQVNGGFKFLRLAADGTHTAGVATLVPMGSAGVKVTAVISGEVDAYLHAGGQYQWDSAAPVAVALASGLVATRLDGSPLRYNAPELLLPDLLVCHSDRADEVRTLLDAAGFSLHFAPDFAADARAGTRGHG